MITTAYSNGQQNHIHVRFLSCILIQTNTFHLKTCFRLKSTLQYIVLRTVSNQKAHKLTERDT